jgi:hypothetical protein
MDQMGRFVLSQPYTKVAMVNLLEATFTTAAAAAPSLMENQ